MSKEEPIIINGVDVSGCEYACNTAFGKNGCKHPMMKNIYCSKNPNCYFKQLARKTTECEKYEQALDEIAAHYQKVIKNITTYDDSYDANISIEALHNISDIINKAKGGRG